MKPTLGVYVFLRNGDYYDYPWRESLKSIAQIADEIVVCECYSDKDGTRQELKNLAAYMKNLRVVQHPWVTDFRQLSEIGNYAGSFLETDWIWQVQADEVIHEKDHQTILDWIGSVHPVVSAGRVGYHHFLGNYETVFDFVYTTAIRICRRKSLWKLSGDAAELSGGNPHTIADVPIKVFHYGKVHEGHVGFLKEVDFQQLYTKIGFPDPKMKEMKDKFGESYCDYVYLFEDAIRKGQFGKFEGTHPAVMENRIKTFKDGGWEQFVSRMKDGLKI